MTPDFTDGKHYAALVRGRRVLFKNRPTADIRAAAGRVASIGARLGKPLALVCAANFGEADSSYAHGAVGLVLAWSSSDARPATVDASALEASADLPVEIWEAVTGATFVDDEPDLLLAAGGWSVASLILGQIEEEEGWEADGSSWMGEVVGEDLLNSAPDDTTPVKALSEEARQRIRDADAPLVLQATYA